MWPLPYFHNRGKQHILIASSFSSACIATYERCLQSPRNSNLPVGSESNGRSCPVERGRGSNRVESLGRVVLLPENFVTIYYEAGPSGRVGLRRRSTAARLLGLWVRIPPGAWMFVCCECCVLSGRGLCDELITRPEESYRLWCVVVCDLETSRMRRPWLALGRSATGVGGDEASLG